MPMFIAMNRFHVAPGGDNAFEEMWHNRESHLTKRPGFQTFHILRGPVGEGPRLYSSFTAWTSKAHFEAWTRSDEFAAGHRNVGRFAELIVGEPQFEGFEVVMTLNAPATGEGEA
jgi:heme-degrading monooxygenase HmoA